MSSLTHRLMTFLDQHQVSSLLLILVALTQLQCEGASTGPQTQNEKPVADAGQDRIAAADELVLLDGSQSGDTEGNVRFAWIQISGSQAVAIQNAASERALVTVSKPGEYLFRLVVTDEEGVSSFDDVKLTITSQPASSGESNRQPRASAGDDLVVADGEIFTLDGSGSVASDGGELTFAWVQTAGPAVAIRNADSRKAFVIASGEGEYEFRLIVTDATGSSSVDELTVEVVELTSPSEQPAVPANSPPFAEVALNANQPAGSSLLLDGSRSHDTEGGALTYAWIQLSGPAVVGIRNADAAIATALPAIAGEYVFRLIVTDEAGNSTIAEARVVVTEAETPAENGEVPDGNDEPIPDLPGPAPDLPDLPDVPGEGSSSSAVGKIEIEGVFARPGAARALTLDGDGDLALFGPHPSLELDPARDAYSVALVLIHQGLASGAEGRILDGLAGEEPGTPFGFELRDTGVLYGFTNAGGHDEIGFGTVDAGRIVHAVLVVRRNFLLAYLDGQLIGSVERAGGELLPDARTFAVGAAATADGFERFFAGQIVELAIWSRALGGIEVLELASGERPPEDLLASWSFDELDNLGQVPDQAGVGPSMRLFGDSHLAELH